MCFWTVMRRQAGRQVRGCMYKNWRGSWLWAGGKASKRGQVEREGGAMKRVWRKKQGENEEKVQGRVEEEDEDEEEEICTVDMPSEKGKRSNERWNGWMCRCAGGCA